MRTRTGPLPALGTALLVAASLTLSGAAGTAADETPPRTRHLLDPAAPDGGGSWYRSPVTVTLRADDGESGIAATEYRVDGGAWQRTEQHPVVLPVAGSGLHTVEYRSTDAAGNTEETRAAHLRIDERPPGTSASVVEEQDGSATVTLTADDTDAGSGIARTEYRVDGGRWQVAPGPEEALFDGTQASFDRWRHVGSGSFEVTADGRLRTVGGLGMLWYPETAYGDVAFRFQWREGRTDGQASNAGAFVRFPDPEEAVAYPPEERHACQVGLGLLLAEWVAINCGHEIQINDGDVDPQQTGSIYNFEPLDRAAAQPNRFGDWNDYEIRTVGDGDYRITVVRNGQVINRWRNDPGQLPSRPFDPPTDLRQFSEGYFGLQNHGDADTIEYRDVRVVDLGPATASVAVAGSGEHTVEFRATDVAGNREPVRSVTFTIG